MGKSVVAHGISWGILRGHALSSLNLAKLPLSVFVAFSALFGSSLAFPVSFNKAFHVFVSVFLLSCASATLNNIHDRDIDALHKRTESRPLPQGRVSLSYAWFQALGLLSLALFLLHIWFESSVTILLGLFAVILYNGVYTPLKRKSLWAMVPGILCGMIPPLIGWTASGGSGSFVYIIIAMIILGFWQIPHTWLVCLSYFPESSKSFLPSFSDKLGQTSLKRILFVWVTAFAVLTMLFAGCGFFLSDLSRWLLLANALGLGCFFYYGLFFEKEPQYGRLFVQLNLALSVVMVLAVTEGFIL